MGEIDHVEQPEDHGEPERHQRQRDADDQAVDDLRQQHEVEIGEHIGHGSLVMAGLVPAIHDFSTVTASRRGCPRHRRAKRRRSSNGYARA